MASSSTTTLALVLQAGAGLVITYVLWTLLASPLRHIPGPFLAKFTDLWRLKSVLGRHPELDQRRLHDELGPVVRLGPNMVSVADPGVVGQIYSRRTVLIKGDFYKAFDLNVNGVRVEVPFSTRNEQMNTDALKPVTPLFSMGQMIKLEPLIDKTINVFLEELTKRFAKPGKSCDIDNWLHYCAWDVIGDITWSKRLGFLEQGKDVLDMIAINRAAHNYISVVGMMTWLDDWLERNPVKRIGPPQYGPLVHFMVERIALRTSGKDGHDSSAPDMLDGFIQAAIAEDKLMGYMFANVAAGSDTVAIELRSIVYYLCKNPKTLEKLYEELDSAKLTTPVPWSKCQELPYLGAVVSEGFRMTPGVGLPLERRISANGMVLSDGKTVIPPGTTVGVNPYVINRDKSVFGADANQFRPERWLQAADEPEQVYQDRVRQMRATDMTFGSGKRGCFGRNLALIEVHKIVASLFCTFDIELVDPKKEWQTHNAWLLFQSDMDVRLKLRR